MDIEELPREEACACGGTHRLDSKIVRIAPSRLGAAVRELLPYGKAAAVATEEDWLARGRDFSAAVSGASEFCRVLLGGRGNGLADYAPLFHLPEDIRLLVALGADALPAARYFCSLRSVPCLFVPLGPAAEDVFAPTVRADVAGKKSRYPAKAPELVAITEWCLAPARGALASSYGRVISKFVALVDYRLCCAATDRAFCAASYDLAREACGDALGLSPSSEREECAETLLSAELKLSAVRAYLGGDALNFGGEASMARLLPRGAPYGDRAFAAAKKLLPVYRLLCEGGDAFAPSVPELAPRISRAAALSGETETELARRAESAAYDEKRARAFLVKRGKQLARELRGVEALLPRAEETYRALGGAAEYDEKEYRRAFASAPELSRHADALQLIRDCGLSERVEKGE